MNFPRVDISGFVPVDPVGAQTIERALSEFEEWRGMKLRAAHALIRTGQRPYKRPPEAVVAKRRAKSKAAGIARRHSR